MEEMQSLPGGYIRASIEEYKAGLGRFRQKYPSIGEKYMAFTESCFASGELNEKHKHLIALGISVYAQDEYCIMYHADAALQTGATDAEIMETVAVCSAFGGGAALSQGVTLVQDVIDEHHQLPH